MRRDGLQWPPLDDDCRRQHRACLAHRPTVRHGVIPDVLQRPAAQHGIPEFAGARPTCRPERDVLQPDQARQSFRLLAGADLLHKHQVNSRASGDGRLLLQSGSFAFSDIGKSNRRGPLFDNIVKFVNRVREDPRAVSERIFMSCGVYESLIYENRSLVPLLDSTGMQVKFVEARDGHNWENWRDRLREGLSWLFPGPLMFIYE